LTRAVPMTGPTPDIALEFDPRWAYPAAGS
jgi:hypothetical protein